MAVDSAHTSRWEIAEVVFGIPFLASIAIQWAIPLTISREFPRQLLIFFGIMLTITGLWVIVSGRRALAQYAQPTDPGHPTSQIVKTGVFAVSRNPLYLGTVLVILGIALVLNNLWMVITLLLSFILSHPILILPEERHLEAKFPAEYREYASTVRRWFGRK